MMPDDEEEVRLTMLVKRRLRDKIEAMGKRDGRVMMREAEALILEAIASREAKVSA